jgi:putative transcription factor
LVSVHRYMPSFCELCGGSTQGLKTVIIDGSIFNVCLSCSKRGKPYQPPIAKKQMSNQPAKKQMLNQPPNKNPFKKPDNAKFNKIEFFDDYVLKSDFANIIHNARLKKGYTQEYVANKINEKVTLFKKIETGGLKPNEIISKKLERFLGIQLYQRLIEDDDEV